ncbi:MAG: sigma-70 family RNA polymerase sigma factor [Eubacteriales bacterium]|nr:sigma-70 family RNA polymerase sigma factor [Eubacteriales bacterium]
MREIGAVYQACFQDVYRYALKLTGEEQLAFDLTSDTFLRAMDALDGFRGQSQLRVWLCQITRNLYFSHLRREKRLVPLDGVPEPEAEDAFSRLFDREEARGLQAIAGQIREPYRQVFSLRVWGEMPFGEIGKLFGRSANWACVAYHRARKMIREEYEEET